MREEGSIISLGFSPRTRIEDNGRPRIRCRHSRPRSRGGLARLDAIHLPLPGLGGPSQMLRASEFHRSWKRTESRADSRRTMGRRRTICSGKLLNSITIIAQIRYWHTSQVRVSRRPKEALARQHHGTGSNRRPPPFCSRLLQGG